MIVGYSQEPSSDVVWFVVNNSGMVSCLCFLLLELQVAYCEQSQKSERSGLGMRRWCGALKIYVLSWSE